MFSYYFYGFIEYTKELPPLRTIKNGEKYFLGFTMDLKPYLNNNTVLVIETKNDHGMAEQRRFFFELKNKELDNLDFPAYTKDNFGIHAVEYVDQFFPSAEPKYIKELLKRTDDIGVKNVLIMIDTGLFFK